MTRFALCLALVCAIVVDNRSIAHAAGKPPARPPVTSLPRIPAELHTALQDRRFAEAIKLIDGELKKSDAAHADYLLYLRGRAQTELKLYAEAIATFQRVTNEYPKSDWSSRARFGVADVLIRQRNYHEAGEIYEREAARLLSAGRRDELTAIYLEFADRFFAGVPNDKAPGQKAPNYGQALSFYKAALSLRPSNEKRQQIELRVARCLQELGQLPQAIQSYRQFVASYGLEAESKKRAPAELEMEARFQLGRALLAAGEPAEARKTWQDLLEAPAFKVAGDGRLAEAQFQLSRTYGIPQPASDGDLELGVAALETFLKAHPNHRLAPAAALDIALSYGSRGRFDDAIARLKSFIDTAGYAASEEMPKARNLLGEILFSQKKFDEAIAVWRAFLAANPNHKATTDVLKRIIDVEYAKGQEQFRAKNYNAAREIWEQFLKDHPLDERGPAILFSFGQMKYAEALARISERSAQPQSGGLEGTLDATTRSLFEQAIGEWKALISKFPDSESAKQAALTIGIVLEERLGRLADAIEAYKKAEENDPQAAGRITRLTERQMEIVTPRKFRTSQKPSLRLSSRNVEKVTVKVYRVEMTDYFRKMHLAGGIEKLDIALIDPDQTFDFAIKDYEKYRPFENEVEIPVKGAGVWAVTVASDKLEATTMLVVSDLDVIVKCSRNELFVFAEDVAAQKPAEGVRLLLSDGDRIFAEETTNKEGVLQKPFEELKTVKDLRVFAVRDGQIASTVNALEGVDFAVGLTPVGYLFTDRPAYRHGELVSLKGIVRWVADDRFKFKEGERYKLDVSDPRGRSIHSADVQLNRFGTFATSFVLPESVPQGDCTIRLFQPSGKQSYSAEFKVHESKLEQIRLEVDLPRKIYFRGEKIEGKIRLRYYYGTPLAGRTVQYQLADDRIQTGTTNAAGELAFEFPTRRYSESQSLALVVDFPERNLRTAEKIFLAARGFDLRVSAVRPVYVSGETFDATVTATDPAGEPIAATLKLDILEKLGQGLEKLGEGHKVGERLIESHEIKTDKEKGTARYTVRIEKAGRYVLRATGVDRFGTKVSGSHDVLISGKDDDVRLRILADRHNYQMGDTAHVTLHWREKPALALVAYEGAALLGYRLVELKTGANPLEFPIETKLAPNFILSVAVIDQTRFHQASSDFAVARKLRLAVKPAQPNAKPGEPVTVEITAADPQGKPVVAEISLAMVQRNLLDFFSGTRVSLNDGFTGTERKPSMRTMTSCTFLYHPQTHGMSEALLAEENRARTIALEGIAKERLDDLPRNLNSQVRVNGESRSFFDEYKTLLKAGRYDEAESLARQAKERDPNNPFVNNTFLGGHVGGKLQTNANLASNGLWYLELNELGKETAAGLDQWSQIRQRGVDFSINSPALGGGMGGMGGGMPGQVDKSERAPAASGYFGARIYGQRDGKKRLAGSTLSKNGGDASTTLGLDRAKTDSDNGDGISIENLYDSASRPGATSFAWGVQTQNGTPRLFYEQRSSGETSAVNGFVGGDRPAPPANTRLLSEALLGETGYWNPAIVTGADGKATVTFRLPPRSTAWKLRASGIDGEALAGEAEADLVAKKDFFGEIRLPQSFTAGDRADLLVEVQNSTVEKGAPIEARLKVTLGERTTELKKSLVSSGPGISELVFPASFGEPGTAEFELTVESGSRRDVTRSSIPVRPYGLPVVATASGTAGQSTIAFLDVDHRLNPERPQLEILIGPSVDRALVDAIVGSGFSLRCDTILPSNSLERASSDILGGLAVLSTIRASRTDGTPEATALVNRVRSALAQLVASQRQDGGWSWSGSEQANRSDRFLSARALWAFAAARRAGFAVAPEAIEKATTFASTALTAAAANERDLQATLFHALTEAGKGDFSIGNRLYRERNSLGPFGLLNVALALAHIDRKEMGKELLALVRISVEPHSTARPGDEPALARPALPNQSGVELRALYLLALEEIDPTNDKAGKLADWLMAARQGSRWIPEKANGPAVAALARWYGQIQQLREKYTLTVYVNDRLLQKLTVDPSADPSRRLEVPAAMLVQGRPQRINFDLEGRARFSYSAVLSGFVPAERLTATTDDWFVNRFYEPAQQMLDGQPIPRGFGILSGSYTSFRNNLTQLPVGMRGEVILNVYRRHLRGTADEPLDYLVITEPIPAGTTVLPDSVKGNFERYEIAPGEITFYVGDIAYPGELHYTLIGYAAGSYRAAPTVVRSFYQPQRIVPAQPKSLDVLPRQTASRDEYRLTPEELFELGKRLIAKGEFAKGAEHLTKLVKQYHLRDEPYREAIQALFKAALATGQDAAIVENFEIIKEKLPGIEIEFDSILRVAKAYRTLGEYERSFLVYRATIEAAFERESQIAGFLDDQKQFLRSVQVMERLLHEFPAESYIATATYALAQEVFGKAPSAADNEELRRAGLTRIDLVVASLSMFDHFVSTWPSDPAADQADFAMASAYLSLEKYDAAAARCRLAVKRYPDTPLADSFWYVIGYSQYAQGRMDDALETCRRVAEMTRKDPQTGEAQPAENKWQAIYIRGEIFHSLGKPAQAIAEYDRVKDKFADAREAIDYFVHRRLALPEVVTIRPNEPAKIALSYRNIPRVDLKVYRVDLLKFGLLERNLSRITAINLAGIRPYHQLSIELGDGKDYRDREKTLSLPLKEDGAYLLVCRGDDEYASGLVLVSSLELAVQEEAQSGRVRVTAKDAVADRYVRKVHVKVIGSDNTDFISGETDLRGIFTADAIRGKTTVIARADGGNYAFFRGTTAIGSAPVPASEAPKDGDKKGEKSQSAQQGEAKPAPLLENVNRSNSAIQQQQRDSYRNLLHNRRKGVQAKEAY